jgi:hypothetical protein
MLTPLGTLQNTSTTCNSLRELVVCDAQLRSASVDSLWTAFCKHSCQIAICETFHPPQDLHAALPLQSMCHEWRFLVRRQDSPRIGQLSTPNTCKSRESSKRPAERSRSAWATSGHHKALLAAVIAKLILVPTLISRTRVLEQLTIRRPYRR